MPSDVDSTDGDEDRLCALAPEQTDSADLEHVLLAPAPARSRRYHRPVVADALDAACDTFSGAGVRVRWSRLVCRGYRPCTLCWSDTGTDGGGSA